MPGKHYRRDDEFTVRSMPPSYSGLSRDVLMERVEKAWKLASPCVLCGRKCLVERAEDPGEDSGRGREGVFRGESPAELGGEVPDRTERRRRVGVCRTGRRAVVSSYGPHFGEEPPITGRRGSGTIFFSYCNLKCIFCQNYEIAHLGEGREVRDEELAAIMLELQEMGCHNINLVSPTHVVPQILSALVIAVGQGLRIPLVYNTGGYDTVEALKLLDGIVDIYMPDMKYGTRQAAEKYSLAPNYPEVNFAAVKEMHRQVGDLVTDELGIAVRGLLVRHLVLPGNLAGTEIVMKFIAEEISKDTYVNIMDQYRPYYKAVGDPVLGRRITREEYREALRIAREAGLTRVMQFCD